MSGETKYTYTGLTVGRHPLWFTGRYGKAGLLNAARSDFGDYARILETLRKGVTCFVSGQIAFFVQVGKLGSL